MDLRYGMRRRLLALAVAAIVNTALTGLFCPVVIRRPGGFGHLSWETRSAVFVPLWSLQGREVARGWLFLQAAGALLLGFGVWFVYPQFRPTPPRC